MSQATLDSARTALAAGQLGEAEAVCLELIRRDSADAEAMHLLGLVRFRSGRAEDAVRLLERAVRTAPQLVSAYADLGAMLITAGRPLEAAAQLRAAAELDPANVEVQVNLGNARHAQGELQAAEAIYRTALGLDARHVRGMMSLGNLLCQLRRPQEALAYLAGAAALAPGAAAAHQFLGNALRDLSRTEEAIASYRNALRIEPANADANESLGLLLRDLGRLEEALVFLDNAGTHFAGANALQCLLRLGRHDEFFRQVRQASAQATANLHAASLSAYASYHLGRPDSHPFCPNPLAHVKVVDRYTRPGADAEFLRDLIREASQLNAVWEPRGITTLRGYQTGGNIFDHGSSAIARLQRDMLAEMQRYRASLLPASMTMVTRWPANGRLRGWFVRLLTGGQQYYHNHPYGWATGCLYLQMPQAAAPGEGAIEFGLESGSYPPLSDKPPPTLIHQPKAGQVAFFPSSLYHRTIPFSSDEERMCIAFDLLPE